MSINKMFKLFREQVLQITLQQMSNKTGVKLSTISAFENGRSNNIQHIKHYIDCCENDSEIATLTHNIINTFKD